MSSDPLDDVFDLEHRLYTQGYTQGLEDGARAGRIEGRSFGMEKGFEKFLESGRLAGKALVWANRLPRGEQEKKEKKKKKTQQQQQSTAAASNTNDDDDDDDAQPCALPPLPRNARLGKNVRMLYALVEPDTLSTENTDEAVQDFDDRVKRAQGKAKIVERIIS